MSSAQVTAWPERIALTLLVLGVVALALWGMRAGWRGRARRQADIPAPAREIGAGPATVLLQVPGRYVATSRHGDWLDRIVVHDLGVPSPAILTVHPQGVHLRRTGAGDVAIPAGDLVEVRIDSAVGADVVDGALVLTWRLGDHLLDTGFRPRAADAYGALVSSVSGLLGDGTGLR